MQIYKYNLMTKRRTVLRNIKLETGTQDRFASFVAGWCGQSGSCRVEVRYIRPNGWGSKEGF